MVPADALFLYNWEAAYGEYPVAPPPPLLIFYYYMPEVLLSFKFVSMLVSVIFILTPSFVVLYSFCTLPSILKLFVLPGNLKLALADLSVLTDFVGW